VLKFVALFHESKHGGNSNTIIGTNGGNAGDELAVFKLDGNAAFIEIANSNHIKVALDADGLGAFFAFGGWDGEENVATFVFFVWNAKSIAPLHDGLASFSKVERWTVNFGEGKEPLENNLVLGELLENVNFEWTK